MLKTMRMRDFPRECITEHKKAKAELSRLERELKARREARHVYQIETDIQKQKDYIKSLD